MLPPFALFPPASVRRDISKDDWNSFLDCSMLLIQKNLLLPSTDFGIHARKESSVVDFIFSYITESAHHISDHFTSSVEKEKRLKKEIFLLMHRVMTEVDPLPQKLLQYTFLGDLSVVYARFKNLKSLLELLWRRKIFDDNPNMQESKLYLMELLDSGLQESTKEEIDEALLRTGALLKVSFNYGQFLMIGSDFLDALSKAFENSLPAYQSKLLAIGYLSLISLLESRNPQISTLLDHLYGLKATLKSKSLLQTLSSSTPLLRRLRENLVGQDIERARPLLQELETFEKSTTEPAGHQTARKPRKGKDKARQASVPDMHVHQMSLVTQVQDLFPDLGSAFIVKLLAEYEGDTEQVITHLLEDSLPNHLKEADRGEVLNLHPTESAPSLHDHETLPMRTRRNVYDNDAFDRLAIPTSSIRQGRTRSPEATLPQRPSASAKAAILSALAAFDSDSDERDDTYDAADVGGTVDSVLPGTSVDIDIDRHDNNGNDEALFRVFQTAPATFNRDASTRRGPARVALRLETGMTDEAIEGWAIMLQRDPRRLHKLEMRFSTSSSSGAQTELASSAYRTNVPDSTSEDSDAGDLQNSGRARGAGAESGSASGQGRGRGYGRGCGRGRGGGGGGGGEVGGRGFGGGNSGDVSGPSDERSTQIARQRKDAHKGSRANHNRRDQRARKMARGGMMMAG